MAEEALKNSFVQQSHRSAKISEAFFDFLRDQELLSDS